MRLGFGEVARAGPLDPESSQDFILGLESQFRRVDDPNLRNARVFWWSPL